MTAFNTEAVHDLAYGIREVEMLRDLEAAIRRLDFDACTPILVQLTELRHDRDAGPSYLRSHEPPRNSGEGTAVDGPMPLAGGDDANAPT